MKKIILFITIIISHLTVCSQEINLTSFTNGDTYNSCSSILHDSGGGNSLDYQNNEDYTVTYCNPDGGIIGVNVSFMNLEDGVDGIIFYDGINTSAPVLGSVTGFGFGGSGDFTSTGSCITIRFISDGSVTFDNSSYAGGFDILIGCVPVDCQVGIPAAADECTNAPLICSLDGYCGNTGGWYTQGVNGGSLLTCGSVENNSWIKFIAEFSTATFQLTSSNCLSSSSGVQAEIYDTDCNTFTSVSNCLEQSTSSGSDTLIASGLTIGGTYYIMVDGFAGNICDYSITALTGVATVNIEALAGTDLCPTECTELQLHTSTPGATFTWSAPIAAGLSTTGGTVADSIVTLCPIADGMYTIYGTANGICGGSVTDSIVIQVGTPIVDFHTENTSFTPIAFPSTMSCIDSEIYLVANDSATAGGYITPALLFKLRSSIDVNDNVKIFSGGTTTLGSGTQIYSNVVSNNTILSVYGDHLSPSTDYYLEICDVNIGQPMGYEVFDGVTNALLGSGSNSSGSGCTRYGPFSPSGSATWATTAPANSFFTWDDGYAWFDPGISGPGVFDFTYYWNSTTGCIDSATHTITVTNPFDASWTSPGTICASDGSINLNVEGSPTTTGGTWYGTGVSGNTFNPTSLNGNYDISYVVGNFPCNDSVTHTISVIPLLTGNLDSTICNGDSFVYNGTTYSSSNLSGTETITSVNGCDSVVTVTVTELPLITGIYTNTICNGGSHIYNGTTYNSSNLSGTEMFTAANGCDSVVSVTITELPLISGVLNPTICNGESFVFNGTTFNALNPSGVETLIASNGCDSLVTVTINELPVITGVLDSTLCAGESFMFNGTTYNSSNTSGNDTLIALNGCDSIVAVNVTITPLPTIGINSASECENISGSGVASGIDVTGLDAAINAVPGSVTWYTDNTYSTSFTPTNETVTHLDVYYFEVTVNGCSIQGSITYTVTGNIVLNDPTPELCEDNFGSGSAAGINLTNYNSQVFSGGLSYTWGTANSMNTTITDGDIINVSVQQGSCPVVNIDVHFSVNSLPTVVVTTDSLCDIGGNQASFDLTSLNNTVGQGNVVNWFSNSLLTNQISPASAFLSPSTTVYAEVTNSLTNCTNSTPVNLSVISLPTIVNPGDLTACDSVQLPLLSGNQSYFSGANQTGIQYFSGDWISSSITPMYIYDYTSTTPVCSAEENFNITINISPLAQNQTFSLCEDALGSGTISGINLTVYNNAVGGNGNTVNWYDNNWVLLANATNITISNSDFFNAVIDNGLCSDTALVNFTVTGTILLNNPNAILCEDLPGSNTLSNINLEDYNSTIFSSTTAFYNWFQDVGLTIPLTNLSNTTINGGLTAYVDVLDGNCNNNIMVNFTVASTFVIPMNESICNGDSILLGGIYQSQSGTYYDSLQTMFGCDSIIVTSLQVHPVIIISQTEFICDGDSVLIGGVYQNQTGIYYDSLQTTIGCDSIIMTSLSVNLLTSTLQTESICEGDSMLIGGAYQSLPGTYYDSLQTIIGCDSIVVTTLTIKPQLTINQIEDTTICFGSPLTLTAVGSGSGIITWYSDTVNVVQIGTGNTYSPVFTVGGTYTFYVNEVGDCSSSYETVNVTVSELFANFTATPLVGSAPLNVNFQNLSSGSVNYLWEFDNGLTSTILNPSTIYTETGSYNATLTVSLGNCSAIHSVVIEVKGKSVLIIPNIFTPNGDGSNDVFTVTSENLKSIDAEIYSRWGQLMYHWDEIGGFWNGRTLAGSEVPDGTYFYIISAEGNDGTEYFEKGGFTLIR